MLSCFCQVVEQEHTLTILKHTPGDVQSASHLLNTLSPLWRSFRVKRCGFCGSIQSCSVDSTAHTEMMDHMSAHFESFCCIKVHPGMSYHALHRIIKTHPRMQVYPRLYHSMGDCKYLWNYIRLHTGSLGHPPRVANPCNCNVVQQLCNVSGFPD
jgi:hypothetical protein